MDDDIKTPTPTTMTPASSADLSPAHGTDSAAAGPSPPPLTVAAEATSGPPEGGGGTHHLIKTAQTAAKSTTTRQNGGPKLVLFCYKIVFFEIVFFLKFLVSPVHKIRVELEGIWGMDG